MRYVNGTIGLALAALAFLHVNMPDSMLVTAAFATGSVLAFLTLAPTMSTPVARALAVCATACMFFYFAGFFSLAPQLHSEWYMGMQAREAFSMLMSAFAMIPVLACYSCVLKADQDDPAKRRKGFFTVVTKV